MCQALFHWATAASWLHWVANWWLKAPSKERYNRWLNKCDPYYNLYQFSKIDFAYIPFIQYNSLLRDSQYELTSLLAFCSFNVRYSSMSGARCFSHCLARLTNRWALASTTPWWKQNIGQNVITISGQRTCLAIYWVNFLKYRRLLSKFVSRLFFQML